MISFFTLFQSVDYFELKVGFTDLIENVNNVGTVNNKNNSPTSVYLWLVWLNVDIILFLLID